MIRASPSIGSDAPIRLHVLVRDDRHESNSDDLIPAGRPSSGETVVFPNLTGLSGMCAVASLRPFVCANPS